MAAPDTTTLDIHVAVRLLDADGETDWADEVRRLSIDLHEANKTIEAHKHDIALHLAEFRRTRVTGRNEQERADQLLGICEAELSESGSDYAYSVNQLDAAREAKAAIDADLEYARTMVRLGLVLMQNTPLELERRES